MDVTSSPAYNSWPMRAAVIIGTLAITVLLILSGRLMMLVALTGLLALAALSCFQPLPAVLLLMLLSTNVLKFVDLSHLPYLQVGPGIRLNGQDLVLGLLLAVGAFRLYQRQERPLFGRPLLLWLGMAAISLALGVAAGGTVPDAALNGLRVLSGYLFYVSLVGLIDSAGKLRALIWLAVALMLVTVALQLLEATLGRRLASLTSVTNEYYASTRFVQVGGISAPYLWNRASGFLVVGLFLALGRGWCTGSVKHSIVAAIALLGFVVALIRQWYLYVAAGVLAVLLMLPRKGRWRAVLGATLVALSFLGLLRILSSAGPGSSYPLVDAWLGRMATVTRFQEERNFAGRVQGWNEQLQLFLGAPLFGYGPGSLDRLWQSGDYIVWDTGMPNTLLQYGFCGWAAIVMLILAFLRRGYALLRALPLSPEQGYAAGLLGAWVVMVAGYSFGLDFFTSQELAFAVGLAMALLDRLHALAPRPVVPASPPGPACSWSAGQEN